MGPGGSGWSRSPLPVVQDPSALASGRRPLLPLHNATLIHPAAVTQAWPPASPSASARVASEHVNRPPVPLLSTSSPIPTLPLLGIRPGFVWGEDSWEPGGSGRGSEDPQTPSICSRCHAQGRRAEAEPCLLWVHVPVWGGPCTHILGIDLYHVLSRCKTFRTSQGGVWGRLKGLLSPWNTCPPQFPSSRSPFQRGLVP